MNEYNPVYFLLAFSVGLFFVLRMEPERKVILKYPTQFNLSEVFKDKSGNCWKYTSKETTCNGTEIETPIQ